VSPEQDELVTVREVAALLKVPISWVYEHTRPECRDPLPCVKLGKYLRFVPADIFEYLNHARRDRPER
jgi:predicted DNA-binding transcriptional regulator AlpA